VVETLPEVQERSPHDIDGGKAQTKRLSVCFIAEAASEVRLKGIEAPSIPMDDDMMVRFMSAENATRAANTRGRRCEPSSSCPLRF
jgi:hypothetical protein